MGRPRLEAAPWHGWVDAVERVAAYRDGRRVSVEVAAGLCGYSYGTFRKWRARYVEVFGRDPLRPLNSGNFGTAVGAERT